MWLGQEAKDKPFATLKTNDAGLAEFKLTPKAEQFRPGEWGQQQRRDARRPARRRSWGQQNLFDLTAEAKDAKGNTAKTTADAEQRAAGRERAAAAGQGRSTRAATREGRRPHVGRPADGLPRRGPRRPDAADEWLDVKDGKATYKLDLPQSVFGTLEIHAYQMLATGEIIRDSRVVYVQPADDLKIDVKADKDVYLPGDEGHDPLPR